jgi:hypothetical protein
MMANGSAPPALPPTMSAVGGGNGDGNYLAFLNGPHGTQDPVTGESLGSVLEGFPTATDWDYALKVREEQLAKADAEIAKMRGESPEPEPEVVEERSDAQVPDGYQVTVHLSHERAVELVAAVGEWADHGCAGAVAPMAEAATFIADLLIQSWLGE